MGRRLCFLLFLLSTTASLDVGAAIREPTAPEAVRRVRFPKCAAVIDITNPPYSAKGDGKTDDTAAIQRAVSDVMGQHKILYFPSGVYLVSKTIRWSKKNSDGKEAWGKNWLQGENASTTVIRLKDGTFTNPEKPESIMWCGGFGSADWFHNYVQDLTFDTGAKNPGAIGLQFYSNNSGAVRNCRFIAWEGSGAIGLDLGHRDMNGPLLVSRCEVDGFRRGISAAQAVNGQTFEHLTLRGQLECGISNEGQSLSISDLTFEGAAPAISTYGVLALVEGRLTGRSGAARVPAIVNYNGGRLFVRDVRTTGYSRAIGDVQTPDSAQAYRITGADKPGSLGPDVSEYATHPALTAFPSKVTSLRLPIKETPPAPEDSPERWAVVDRFGADPTGEEDSSAAIQAAIDSGAATVFLPGPHYSLTKTIIIRGKVSRILGAGTIVDYASRVRPDFRVIDGVAPVVHFEHFAHVHGGVEIDTRRTIVFRSVSDCDLTGSARAKGGEVFLEDFVTHNLRVKNQKVWARQLNIENEGTHLTNDSSDVWVLGYKTERGGTLVDTQSSGRTEILGGFSYTTTAGKLAPMFVNQDASVFTFFGEVCYSGDPFAVLVRETRKGVTRELGRGVIATTPYSGHLEVTR